MEDIKKLINENIDVFKKNNMTQFEIIERCESKRNEVFKIITDSNTSIILKKFTNNKNKKNLQLLKELHIIKTLNENKVNVPEVIFSLNDFYVMKYLKGITLLEYLELEENKCINDTLTDNTRLVLFNFLKWVKSFYNSMSATFNQPMILSDVNLRNFIVDQNNKIYGIDFEVVSDGDILNDLGNICAFLLMYNPSFTDYKYNCVSYLEEQMVDIFNVDIKRLIEEKIKCLNKNMIRRSLRKKDL